ncbi:MAG: hypothetical protein AAGF84_00020 [Planctomycetota bacterium]
MKRVLGFVTSAAVTTSVSAQVTNLSVLKTFSTDNTSVANVIAIDFVGQYTGSQIVLELTSGTILQDQAFGSDIDVAPGSGLAAAAGGLRFDTYLAQGDVFSDGPNASGTPILGGGAIDIHPSDVEPIWNDPTTLNQAFYPSDDEAILNRTNFVVARIAMSTDAQGVFKFFVSINDQVPPVDGIIRSPIEIPIVDGWIPSPGNYPPEPGTAALFGGACLTLLRRRG